MDFYLTVFHQCPLLTTNITKLGTFLLQNFSSVFRVLKTDRFYVSFKASQGSVAFTRRPSGQAKPRECDLHSGTFEASQGACGLHDKAYLVHMPTPISLECDGEVEGGQASLRQGLY